ncbi:MAG: hypothetical protein U1F43_15665 [Myxococcota bacterium]
MTIGASVPSSAVVLGQQPALLGHAVGRGLLLRTEDVSQDLLAVIGQRQHGGAELIEQQAM